MKRYLDLDEIKKVDLPPGREVVEEGLARGRGISIGTTAFMRAFGVRSEAEYKRRMMAEGKIMFHAHIGLNSWKATAEALRFLYDETEKRGLRIDRFGLCLDRGMGLPAHLRTMMPRETGPRLESEEEWLEVGQVVPIQPHAGDFMIGFPNSVQNTELALRAGITTIGNLSQYFAHEIPGWRDDVLTTVETVKALSMLAAIREKGTLVHSYLDDGYGALFTDYATVVGWVLLEKYIIEELVGAKLAPCFGGMTADPTMRVAWVLILKEIFGNDLVGSMFYGDTISYTTDMDRNLGVVAHYVLWDAMAQIRWPTGHAITPIPVTEAVRIPTAQEILQAQVLGRKMEEAAREVYHRFDFSKEMAVKERLVAAGRLVFQRALAHLDALEIDIRDPVRLLYTLKKLGPAQFEAHFGAGELHEEYLHGRKPCAAVDYFDLVQRGIAVTEARIQAEGPRFQGLRGLKVVIASTDVHEHALFVLERSLTLAGMKVFNIGAEKFPDQIVDALTECGGDVLAISTHNGMAYEFAKLLNGELRARAMDVPVFMGGRLNQHVPEESLPKDVTQDLRESGVVPCVSVEAFLEELARRFP